MRSFEQDLLRLFHRQLVVMNIRNSFSSIAAWVSNQFSAEDGWRSRVKSMLLSTPKFLQEEQLRSTLVRLVFLRVLVITLLLLVSAWSVVARANYSWATSHLFWQLEIVLVVSLANVLIVRRTTKLVAVGYVQLLVDVLLSSLVIIASGSAAAIFLYLLVIIGAAALFGGHGAVIIGALSGICYALIASGLILPDRGEAMHLSTLDILGVYLALVGTAVVSSYLAKQAEKLSIIAHRHARDLNELEKKQQQLFNDISEGIITVDINSMITSINQAGRAIIGLSNLDAEHFVGHNLPSLLKRYGVNPSADLLRITDEQAGGELTLKEERSGNEICLSYTVRPLTDSEGNESGRIFLFNDVSHVRNIEERLNLHEQMVKLLSDTSEQPRITNRSTEQNKVQMIGESQIMRQVFQLVDRVALSDASVLISGESGTGKELIAKAIHARGTRANRPFVALNCGAIPENLIESELFGHKKGSFTGAVSDNPGLFKQAQGGTIFLDEIGELPLHLQTKLLRVLQEKRIRAVGDVRDLPIDVRVLAATNKDLKKEIQKSRFREDLYYRLNVVNIYVPPLRDRKEDIPLLVRYFIGHCCDPDRILPQISPEAAQLLMSYNFPGNIRELENIIERALVLGGQAILPEHLPEEVLSAFRKQPATQKSAAADDFETKVLLFPIDLEGELSKLERRYLTQALEQAGGIKKQAAQLLGLNFRSFRYRLKKYGMGDSAGAESDGEEN